MRYLAKRTNREGNIRWLSSVSMLFQRNSYDVKMWREVGRAKFWIFWIFHIFLTFRNFTLFRALPWVRNYIIFKKGNGNFTEAIIEELIDIVLIHALSKCIFFFSLLFTGMESRRSINQLDNKRGREIFTSLLLPSFFFFFVPSISMYYFSIIFSFL